MNKSSEANIGTIQEYRLGTIRHTKNEISGAKSTTPVSTSKAIVFAK